MENLKDDETLLAAIYQLLSDKYIDKNVEELKYAVIEIFIYIKENLNDRREIAIKELIDSGDLCR